MVGVVVQRMMRTEHDGTTALQGGLPMQALAHPGLDRIARLAALSLGTPLAAVGLCGESCLWLVARVGALPPMLPGATTALAWFIEDLHSDPAHRSGLLAEMGIRFWASAPILAADGEVLGAVCVMDTVPRPAHAGSLAALHDLAALAHAQLESERAGRSIDPVSGLPGRHQLLEGLDALLPALGPVGVQGSLPRVLAVIDLARPDELSHMLHAIGSDALDDVVRDNAVSLRRLVGPEMRLFHLAAMQFALLTPSGADAGALTQQLQQDLPRRDVGRAGAFSTTCTSGLAVITPGEAPAADLLRRAHAALDDARSRRAPVGIYSPDQDTGCRRAYTLITDFAAALEDKGSLRLVFQPRLELASGRCVGVEALLRWTHPTLGEVSPGEFVRLIEKTTMARGMMRWVLAEALRQILAWRELGIALQLSINVSPANLEEPDFARHVLDSLAAARLPVTALELEVTENALLDEISPAMQQLRTLSAAGVCIAIDDFGTGYSSLSYLQRLPADVVKIDQSFVRGLTQDGVDEGRRLTLVSAMIGLSHDLGYRVVAEGIETQAAADALRHLKCDEVQGFLFARPMPPAAFLTWYGQRPWQPERRAALSRIRAVVEAS